MYSFTVPILIKSAKISVNIRLRWKVQLQEYLNGPFGLSNTFANDFIVAKRKILNAAVLLSRVN